MADEGGQKFNEQQVTIRFPVWRCPESGLKFLSFLAEQSTHHIPSCLRRVG